nr:P)-dependent oxidoreductase [Streptococcus suis]
MGIKSTLMRNIKRVIQLFKQKEIVAVEVPVDSQKLLKGKVALISGGSGGIGFAIAKAFLQSGCKVIISGTNSQKLRERCLQLEEYGDVKSIVIDFMDTLAFSQNIENMVDLFGRIDIFVNSAGVHTENLNFWELTPQEYDRVMNINLRAPYFASIEMAKYWKSENIPGNILLISSSRGSEPAWSPYGISKWGLNGMVKGLAQLLLDDDIIVNGIAPGSTATPLLGKKEGDSVFTKDNKLGRMVLPDEIGIYATLLTASSGQMLTGEIIHISGGRGIFDIR